MFHIYSRVTPPGPMRVPAARVRRELEPPVEIAGPSICGALSRGGAVASGTRNGPRRPGGEARACTRSRSLRLSFSIRAFRKLYELNFDGARVDFVEYQRIRPDDPMGKAAEAASYLYQAVRYERHFVV